VKRYQFILQHQNLFAITRMVVVLQVSRSGFYEWRKPRLSPGEREQGRRNLDEQVADAFVSSKQRDGAVRIQRELADRGKSHDIKTIRRSMKRQCLMAKARRRFKITTDSDHKLPIAPNLLARNFVAEKPNQKWVGDITYLYTSEGWLYLAVMIDLYSRAVVGWSMGERMTASLVCDALTMAIFRRGFPKGVMVHSDRGSQYCSTVYRNIIDKYSLQQSMSRKGNCWDNACAESFFHSLKVEAIYDEPLKNRQQMRETVFEYIEVDYNQTRRHSANGYLSPAIFEMKKVS
jgi:putative transposase